MFKNFFLLIVGMVLAACAVATTQPLGFLSSASCQTSLGSYQLATSRLKIEVQRKESNGLTAFVLDKFEASHLPDHKHIYCLDHLGSITSSDKVIVRRSVDASSGGKINFDGLLVKAAADSPPVRDAGLLRLIASRTIDESAIILKKIIRLGQSLQVHGDLPKARLLTAAELNSLEPTDRASFEINPFNPVMMARVNERLRQFGMCVVFENFTVELSSQTTIQDYCQKPVVTLRNAIPTVPVVDAEPLAQKRNPGVYYRPLQSYRAVIFAKDDPKGPERWRPVKTVRLSMANLSPIISIGVDRAAFARRDTALIFENGALVDVCIAKGSELEGAIAVPVEFAAGLLRAPTQLLQVSTEKAKTKQALIQAEQNLLAVQNAQLNLQLDTIANDEVVTVGNSDKVTIDTDFGSVPTLNQTDTGRLNVLCPALFAT